MLKNPEVHVKIKLAALWVSTTLCYLYGDYFELYVPDKVDSLISGKNVLSSPPRLFLAAVILSIPPLMVVLSILLKPTLNRILNILFGGIFTVMMTLIAIGSLVNWYSFYVYLAILESILTLMIVWTAIKWPREI